MNEPKFKVGYDMESEYEYQGKTYRIRVGAHRINTSADYFGSVVKCVGTVRHNDSRDFHSLPSQEVVDIFSKMNEVHLVGMKWSRDFEEVIYSGKRGVLCEDDHSVYLAEYAQRFSGFDRFRCKTACSSM